MRADKALEMARELYPSVRFWMDWREGKSSYRLCLGYVRHTEIALMLGRACTFSIYHSRAWTRRRIKRRVETFRYFRLDMCERAMPYV